MRPAPEHELPSWPSSGNRRRLEQQWLELLDRNGLQTYLPESPSIVPSQLHEAVDQFNGGEYWDCHETLEEVWLATPYPERFFYHAIIKVAVGFHHVGRHNRHGARVKLSDGVRLLLLFPPDYMGLRVDRLLADSSSWLGRMNVTGNVEWPRVDKLRRPVIHVTEG